MTYSIHPRAEQDVADALEIWLKARGTLLQVAFSRNSSVSLSFWSNILDSAHQRLKDGEHFRFGSSPIPLSIEISATRFEFSSSGTSTGSPDMVVAGARAARPRCSRVPAVSW